MTHRLIKNGELVLYGPVGFRSFFDEDNGFTDAEVISALADIDGDVVVRLNSGGGIAFAGIAIFNALQARESKVTIHVDAIAASAASIIAMAGDDIIMRTGAMMMIHDASGITFGTARDHEKQAEVLNKLDGELARVYARRTGKTAAAVRQLMDDETWLDGPEAVKEGFATSTDDEATDEPSAFEYRIYAHAPDRFMQKSRAQDFTARVTRIPTAAVIDAPATQEKEMELKDLTADALRQSRPDLVTAIEASHDVKPLISAATEAATKAERDRIAAIHAAAFPGQDALVASLIADGKTPGDAAVALNADYKAKGSHLDALQRMDGKVAGVKPAPTAGDAPVSKAEAEMNDDELKAHYEASTDLKAEFGSFAVYSGFVKGSAAGRLRILSRKNAA